MKGCAHLVRDTCLENCWNACGVTGGGIPQVGVSSWKWRLSLAPGSLPSVIKGLAGYSWALSPWRSSVGVARTVGCGRPGLAPTWAALEVWGMISTWWGTTSCLLGCCLEGGTTSSLPGRNALVGTSNLLPMVPRTVAAATPCRWWDRDRTCLGKQGGWRCPAWCHACLCLSWIFVNPANLITC